MVAQVICLRLKIKIITSVFGISIEEAISNLVANQWSLSKTLKSFKTFNDTLPQYIFIHLINSHFILLIHNVLMHIISLPRYIKHKFISTNINLKRSIFNGSNQAKVNKNSSTSHEKDNVLNVDTLKQQRLQILDFLNDTNLRCSVITPKCHLDHNLDIFSEIFHKASLKHSISYCIANQKLLFVYLDLSFISKPIGRLFENAFCSNHPHLKKIMELFRCHCISMTLNDIMSKELYDDVLHFLGNEFLTSLNPISIFLPILSADGKSLAFCSQFKFLPSSHDNNTNLLQSLVDILNENYNILLELIDNHQKQDIIIRLSNYDNKNIESINENYNYQLVDDCIKLRQKSHDLRNRLIRIILNQ